MWIGDGPGKGVRPANRRCPLTFWFILTAGCFLLLIVPSVSTNAQIPKLAFLPGHLEPELNQPWRAGGGDAAEVHARAGVRIRLLELRVIPGIERLSPQYHFDGFIGAQGKGLLQAEVPVVDTGTTDNG